MEIRRPLILDVTVSSKVLRALKEEIYVHIPYFIYLITNLVRRIGARLGGQFDSLPKWTHLLLGQSPPANAKCNLSLLLVLPYSNVSIVSICSVTETSFAAGDDQQAGIPKRLLVLVWVEILAIVISMFDSHRSPRHIADFFQMNHSHFQHRGLSRP